MPASLVVNMRASILWAAETERREGVEFLMYVLGSIGSERKILYEGCVVIFMS